MKKYSIISSILLVLTFIFTSNITTYANSSWRWISETRPYDVLPFVIILTLFIEVLSIYFIPKVNNLPKTVLFIILANIFSFAAPYLFLYFTPNLIYTFEQTLEHLPIYTIGITYLFVTLVVEIPIVYFGLKKSSDNSKKLLITIASANIVTTILTAIIERIFCRGIG